MQRLVMLALVASCAMASNPSAPFLATNFTGVAHARRGMDGTLFAGAFGSLDIRGSIPMPLDARFPVASNTKLYVALSLYQLQERGRVDLTKNVQDYLDASDMAAFGFPNATNYCPTVKGSASTHCRNITFVQLLDMTSGIPGGGFQWLPFPGSLGAVFGHYFEFQLLNEPGETFFYSNAAFMLGAYMVEKFSGMTFADYIHTHIATPIGLKDTYFDVFNGKLGRDSKRVDEYYQFIDPTSKKLVDIGVCSSEFDLGSASGAGGVVSSQRDEAALYFALFNFTSMGRPLLHRPTTLIELVRPRTKVPWQANLYFAQGLFVIPRTANGSSSGANDNDSAGLPDVPKYITYEGEIVCSHTANLFRVVGPGDAGVPLMTQVWSSAMTYFVTAEQLMKARKAQSGAFGEVLQQFNRRPGLQTYAQNLMDMF